MPEYPVLDAHVHLWDPDRFLIPWLDGNDVLDRPMGPAEYDEATDGLDVEGIVYLQVEVAPPYALTEARHIAELAESGYKIAGIVPWAPLEFGAKCRLFLDELVAISPLIKGVRRIVQDEPNPAFCLDPDFVRGNQLLAEYGLSSDICCKYRQLYYNIELVKKCPETQFIIDHIAKPNILDQEYHPWADQMSEMAELPNVVCKVSGVVTEAAFDSWKINEIKPFVDHVISVFGEDRIVFGSDWPVVTQASSYRRWVDTLVTLTEHLTPEAKQKLWSENGKAFYRVAG